MFDYSSNWWEQRFTKQVWRTIKKIRDDIKWITNNSDNYEKYKEIKFNSDDVDLPLKKMLEFHNMV